MSRRTTLILLCSGALSALAATAILACCPAPPPGKPVVNADQTVIILWDAANKMQHFIRKASFKSEADDFGFLIPSPTQPELAESGNKAFPYLQKLTEPEIKYQSRPSSGIGCGCSAARPTAGLADNARSVKVLLQKEVAGFDAVVLEAKSADALVGWLKEHGYAYSPEIKAWAKPYVEQGWKITALKVAKGKEGKAKKTVAASALRMSFKTDRPLFPYREPDSTVSAKSLGASQRLLRIYFLADARFKGEMTKDNPWTGNVAWADKVTATDRKRILELLKLPEHTGPAQWWLTEFEDDWPYRIAPGDVYFSRDTDQNVVHRPPIIRFTAVSWPTDLTGYAIVAALFAPVVWRKVKGKRKKDKG